ncbi:S1C family serine protease [Falsiroseomonas oryziterrae]|uniref:S1C family serine protease n=1 Tax=Falsiroseomonas oryziterrae TaxID=2911368 RepID=UPI001F3E3379|nr:trypsin-like peptidase domain-containing protein [Roseomonas sp. NPKOSM-4]
MSRPPARTETACLGRRAFVTLALVPAVGCGTIPPASAQRGALASLPDFADLAERVLPAVVNISVTSQGAEVPPELRGTPLERYLRERRGRQVVQGAGSGFVIDPSGLIVTANHVVGNASRVIVSSQSGQDYQARVVGTDELTDLALLRVETRTSLPAVPWGSSGTMRVGQWVLAAGNPFGLGGTVTTGIISARGRDIGSGPFDDFIQTDAPINPGNSGGPLFNLAGEVIGINTAIYSPSGASAGIGFAVPSDLARPVIEQLRTAGRVDRGWLGVQVQDLQSDEPGRRGGGAGRSGVLIAGVERGSPAARAGIRQGDQVVAINGERVDTSRALVRNIAAVPPGQTVRLSILRDGRPSEIPVQVGRRPAAQQPAG